MSSAQLKSEINFSQTGQGILEVIVTIAIGTILVLALVVLSVRTNRSSDFSKANSVASNLAAEGMEIIKNLKDLNGTSGGTDLFYLNNESCTNSSGYNNWSTIFTLDIEDGNALCGIQGKVGYIVIPPCQGIPYNCISFDNSVSGSVTVDNRTYTRTVYLADTPIGSGGKSNCNTNADTDPAIGDWDNIKQFTIEVSFTDSSGTHKSSQSSCITR